MLKKLVWIFLLIWCIAAMTGCNTLRGVGKDIEKAGEGIQKATD